MGPCERFLLPDAALFGAVGPGRPALAGSAISGHCSWGRLSRGGLPFDKSSTVLTMLLSFLFLGGVDFLSQCSAGMVLMGTGTCFMDSEKGRGEERGLKAERGLSMTFLSAVLCQSDGDAWERWACRGLIPPWARLSEPVWCVLIMAWVIVFMQKKQSLIKKIDKKSLDLYRPVRFDHRTFLALLL